MPGICVSRVPCPGTNARAETGLKTKQHIERERGGGESENQPRCVIVDEASHDGSQLGAHKLRSGVNDHGELELAVVEKIAHAAARHAQEGGPGQASEEPGHDHGLDIFGHRAHDKPDDAERQGNEVDRSTAVELR